MNKEPLAVEEMSAKHQMVAGNYGLRKGYKHTEVGVIPEDWEVVTFGDIGLCLIGLTYKPSNVRESGKLVLRSSNIQNMGLAFNDNVYVDITIPEKIIIQDGDILICVRNGSRSLIGKCALLDSRVVGQTFGAFMSVFRTSDSAFIFQQFQSYLIKRQISEHIGATINQITNANLNSFKVPQPVKKEERYEIAKALSDVDALLAKLDQLITKKRDLKQAAMQQLLTGQIRLPGFSKEWVVKQLGEVFTISAGKSKSAYIIAGGRHWIVDMGSVSTDGRLIVSKPTNYSGDFLKIGDLVMPKDDIGGGGIIGKVGYIDTDKTYVLGDHVYRLTANMGNPLFLSYVINGYRTNTELRKKVIGSAQLGLGRKSVNEQEVPFPPYNEQTAIATILSNMDTEISTIEARRDKTKDLKQGMMQELLTGRIRLI
jgi:type I restriction enzyme S subunit